jgi:hypothetical protein
MRFSSVTSIHRVSGRAMREALMVGDRAQKDAGSTGRPSAWSVKSTPIPAMTSCAQLRPTPTLPKLLDLAGELPMDCQTGRKRRGRAEAPRWRGCRIANRARYPQALGGPMGEGDDEVNVARFIARVSTGTLVEAGSSVSVSTVAESMRRQHRNRSSRLSGTKFVSPLQDPCRSA